MKTNIIVSCLTILLAVSSFQILHEIKISTSEITMKKNVMQIKIKFFADDLSSTLSQIVKKTVYFNGTQVDNATLTHLNTYVKSNFAITINNTAVPYTFKNSLIDDNLSTQIKTVWLTYECTYKNPETIKSFELKNTLLFDGIPEQKNISKIILENRETKTLTFENQNDDVKKLIQY
ncbi:DUF6702 family protein [Cytophaga aurantiaca]|uniref:DUF6702 family protein n=1 Tax=Cytophaga aurantiaca TaxID=29530 RepID=UPI0003705E5A|nr:DUF6702 family protein [Cytophaga aurantiaca]